MKKIIATLSLVSATAFASDVENSFKFSVGLGHQYAGILGAQFSYKTEYTKYYGSVGVIGLATGFETTLEKNSVHAYGLVIGKEELRSEDGFIFATYNYHFNGFNQKGFVIGAGIGITREDEGGFWRNRGKTKSTPSFSLNLGYKF